MKKINVISLPLREVIQDLSEELNTVVHNQCDEYWINIPDDIGEGSIRGVNFPGGLGIIQYECIFKEDIEIHFSVNLVHPLKFLYCLEGKVDHRFEDDSNYKTIQKYQSAVVASSEQNGHVLRFGADTETIINSLELDREVFKPRIQCEMKSLDSRFRKLFEDIDAKEMFFHEGNYSLGMADLFHEIKSCDHEPFERKIFLQGQSYLMLALQIIQFQDDVRDAGSQSLLRQSDLDLIKEAATMIQENLEDIGTIDKIGQQVGLNLNKMQLGFQHLYGLSVNGYMQDVRMEKAKGLLEKNDYNISEIVHKIGLSSKSYFSKIFKETYHMTPSEYRKRHRRFMVGESS